MKEFVRKQSGMIALTVIVLLLAAVGITYAIWTQTNKSETQVVQTGTLDVKYNEGTTIGGEMEPKSDADGLLIDPFTITVNNTSSTLPADYVIRVKNNPEGETSNYLSHEYLKISLDGSSGVTLSTLYKDTTGSNENETVYVLHNDVIGAGTSKTHNIRVWLDESTPSSESGKKVNLLIEVESVVSEDTCAEYPDTLTCKIFEDWGGQNDIKQKAKPNFENISTGTDNGLYTMADDYGISYYFRGTHDLNNNVLFGGFQWKIIRINGDGSIRLIYNGTVDQFTTNNTVNTTVTDTQVNAVKFNASSNDKKYVGYTYDVGVDSTIKTENETWYSTNLSSYDTYISDTLFCNDKSGEYSDGSDNFYSIYDRIDSLLGPTLKCANKNDSYTKSDTKKGNGLSKQKVGLITIDEVVFAGGKAYESSSTYLNTGQNYWTMSPNSFWSGSALDWVVGISGAMSGQTTYTNSGLRPVINLKSTVEYYNGDGSATNPYQIKLTNGA